ncbi:MAG: alpha/beta hydrolase [Planctomycetaceae bacterium]|nr:alpha/beta hydrolase [Planctomycetaceae bacterium]
MCKICIKGLMLQLGILFLPFCLLIVMLSEITYSQEINKTEIQQVIPIMKTLGGRQFWGDVHFFRELRIQKNVLTNHYRLLDGNDQRLAFGTFQECLQELNKQRKARNLEPMSGEAVVLLHGIMRTAKSFEPLQRELEKQGYLVFSVNYPSTQITIEQASINLQQVLKSLEGVERFSLVGHSMGGLVIRAWSRDHEDARLEKVVMLGTPNQGAELADALKDFLPYQWVMGKAGQQLGTDEKNIPNQLPVPTVPVGIIAGGRGEKSRGYNPWLPGDNDGTVTVASTHLKGEAAFLRIACLHAFIMRDPKAIQAVAHFIKQGTFSPNAAKPILANESDK